MGRTRAGDGFTLFELIIVICVVAVVGSVVLERFLRYQEYAERTAMEQTIAAMRSALALRASAHLVKGGLEGLPALENENPFGWLAQVPGNYRGEIPDAGEVELTPGSWYFDLKTRQLVYVPRLVRFFEPGPGGKAEIRFRTVARIGSGQAGVRGASFREVSELTVRPVEAYAWRSEP